MKTAFIIHGASGYPEENWFPWLKKELESIDYEVFVPAFPTPKNQTLSHWLDVFDNYKENLSYESIVIGHSLGVPFLLNLLELYAVKAAFFISGFTGKTGNIFDPGMKTFAQRGFNWEKIKSNCKHFYVFHSDNDPYVKLEKAEELAKNLGVEVILIKNAGHFNTESGYTKFPQLLDEIRQLSQTQKEK